MKALVLCLALIACAPAKPSRSVELTLHADTDFSPMQKAQLCGAAALWQQTTNGRAQVRLVFDVEPNVQSYLEHERLKHNTITHAPSTDVVVKVIDLLTDTGGKTQTLAITQNDGYGRLRVFFIDDRIRQDQYFSIAAHELGHTIGFPDLEAPNAIMSRIQGVEATNSPSAEDIQLCKTARYCDE